MADKSDKVYKTVHGFVAFEPNQKEVNGQQVRTIVVQASGLGKAGVDTHITVWPDFDGISLTQGDCVTVSGSYNVNRATNDEGVERVFHNISATRLANHGSGLSGRTSRAASTSAEVDDDEDLGDF